MEAMIEVQLISAEAGGPERRYQLSPAPTAAWWAAFDSVRARKAQEVVGMHPDTEILQAGESDLLATAITENTSAPTDDFVGRLVRATNRELHSAGRHA